ncbi:hypothetical protein MKJ04_00840 [Pontibacter sp. E15-1]|uniref:hypothetical protein n=1 Tax=Pontibacter sp. E15-1 TaxID=2919918 RepID=UPI001F4F15B8|nr:hypothetical protein [Pontibacter sp. E15-1]MCJ8163368.1 hypothetical protein [Pontibacter sp. E15-1]
MKRTRQNKKTSLPTLLLLAVFVSLYLVQFVCSLPLLAQKLQPVPAHTAVQGKAHEEGHAHASHTATAEHHGDAHTHTTDAHAESSEADGHCCAEQQYAPFVKTSVSVYVLAPAQAVAPFITQLYLAMLHLQHRIASRAVSHSPPEAPPPKIPDIRIFLHSFLI